MATAKSLVVKSIRDPPDVEIVNKPVPIAAQGTAVIEVLASWVSASNQYLVSHEVPGFGIPMPGVFGACAVGRVVSAETTPMSSCSLDSWMAGTRQVEEASQRGLARRPLANSTPPYVPLENATPLDEDLLLGKLGYDVAELSLHTSPASRWPTAPFRTLDIKAGETVIVGARHGPALARLKATVPRVETVVLTGDTGADAQALRAFGPCRRLHRVLASHRGERADVHKRRTGRPAPAQPRGLYGPPGPGRVYPYFQVMLNNFEIKGRWMYTRKEPRALIKLVEAGVLKIGKPAGHEVSGRFKLEDWEAALDAGAKNSAWGQMVVFTP
ncbi:GroES-like protein [Biscogniauxia mediterranea]|nr:GroES-like protein [Biscogniauxia mediterranea]